MLPDSKRMLPLTVKCTVYKLHLRNLVFQKEIQLLLHQFQTAKPHRFVNGGQTIAAGKRTAAAALIIHDPIFKAGHIRIVKWDLVH